jgi:predicted NAD/FAD-binding protein
VVRQASHVTITCAGGERRDFDHVVIATHADQALTLLDEATPGERALLSAFSYSMNRAILHRDPRLMPKRRRLWSSWNYIGTGAKQHCAVTYWMNALQPLATTADFFVSLNPAVEPEPNSVLRTFDYAHPIFDARALAAQRNLWDLQGQKNTWYCGAYFGSGFHEDGLQSGLAVAEALGGAMRPWSVPDPSNRIYTKPLDHPLLNPYVEAAE